MQETSPEAFQLLGHAEKETAVQILSALPDNRRRYNPSANTLGLGLVLIGAAATAAAMFLPFVQPVGGMPVVGANTVFELFGWHVLWPLLLIPYFGYRASQGKRSAQWALIGFCVLAAVGVVALATAKSLRTMHIIGPGGPAASSGPGIVAGLAVAIYVAAAGVAIATVGALALLQEAGTAAAGDEAHAADPRAYAVRLRWRTTWPLAVAVFVVVGAVAGYLVMGRPATTSPDSATSHTPTKLTPTQTALQRLLLSPEQISRAMGTTGLTVDETTGTMPNLAEQVPDTACLPIVSPAESQVYRGSGWTTMVGQTLAEPGDRFIHKVEQVVVSFPSAKEAGAFFTASARSWPDCAERHFNLVVMGTNMAHTSGPVSNNNGILSITQNQDGVALTFTCQRALTVANNTVIDVAACSLHRTAAAIHSNAAAVIAHQIAAKVPAK
jgi:hypothetical protein